MLKRHLLISVIFILFTSCQSRKQEILDKRNKNLLDFKSKTVLDMDEIVERGEKKFQELNSPNFNSKTDTIRFKDNNIYVSYIALVNGCAEYIGDINYKNDSIFLNLINVGEYECTEQRADRLTFIINNPKNRKFAIVKW
jgi:hypothetical protein